DGQSRAMKTAAVNRGDVHAAIVGDDKAIGILRIDPDVVRVSAPGNVFEIFATVAWLVEGTAGNEHFVISRGGDRERDVVAGVCELCECVERPEQATWSATKSTRSQWWPPSLVR